MMVGMALMPVTNTNASTPASKELRVAMQMDMSDFNMFNLGTNSMWKSTVLQWAFEGLATTDYDQKPFPLLAQGWEFDENSLTLIVQLRQDVLFHDGSALTAEDVVFTYSALRAGTTYSDAITNAFDMDDDWMVSQAEIDASVFAIDTYTIAMQLAQPYRDFFTDTLTIPIIPSSVWADHLYYGGPYDGTVDVTWSAPEAAMGTGPFQYDDGVPDEYRRMVKNPNYWGIDDLTPDGYALCPDNIDSMRFVVYGDADDAISALRAGTIDIIGWPLDSSRASYLELDGNVNIHYLQDKGEFFLAFNMKKEPMNSLGFRKAVEYLIDKEAIASGYQEVDATAGSYCLSDSYGEWQSDSPIPYPYDASLESSLDALESAGFVDGDGDGWRDLPDGTPMDTLTIVSPPKDYDPGRFLAAQMVAFRLNEVGIRAVAIDESFDTLISSYYVMDYDMVTLGYSFTAIGPIDSVFYLWSPLSSSNMFGFWSDLYPNPFYSDLGAVSTLADEETQELANQLATLEEHVNSAMLVDEQMVYVKAAQDLIAEALPASILYYRLNPMATGNAWSGWLPYQGTLLNRFSLSNLQEGQSDRVFVDLSSDFNIGLTAPKTFIAGEPGRVYAVIVDDQGQYTPAKYVWVMTTLHLASGGTDVVYEEIELSQDPTDIHSSMFMMPVTFSEEGYGTIAVAACKDDGSVSNTDSVAFTVVSPVPNALMLSVAADDPMIRPGESTVVTVGVEDGYGYPVEGATVAVDTALAGTGYVDAETMTTDANGIAQMTFTAPADGWLVNS
ncbi:MAG: hypothetical protein IH630_07285, partial [Thermoplasmata archaeon]|nr:hypothetical protein [Thermoplasmata archaeon]